jgi:orotidine-5'-phosphate decarboxylase
MNIIQKLNQRIEQVDSLVCVGLDSAIEQIPLHLQRERYPQFAFNKAIIDATAHSVCAYKPNSAFYEARGEAGMKELKMTFDYIHNTHPEIVTILDAKRADIGSTNEGYVRYIFDYLEADAVTLHPYLGREALAPFLKREDKGCVILCRTSNPGSGELQDLLVPNEPLYIHIARIVAEKWNSNNNCMLVVGATYPEEMKKVRSLVGSMPFLVPGVGAQGGDVEKTVLAGLDKNKKGMIISSSRGIIFASKKEDFAQKAGKEAKKLKEEINLNR